MDNAFPKWGDGDITVRIIENQTHFNAGDFVSGSVHVAQRKPFKATSLKLQLVGTEYTQISEKSADGEQEKSINSNVVVSYNEVVLLDLTPFNDQSMIVSHDFPFTIQIPTNLRPTFFKPLNSRQSALIYVLRAQYTPVENDDWANENYLMSKFRGSQEICVHNSWFPSGLLPSFTQTTSETFKLGLLGRGE